MPSALAAILFAALSGVVGAFQIALAFGVPWGELTMGGRYKGSLPPQIRIAPVLSVVLIVGFAIIVLSRAELAFPGLANLSAKLIWGVVAYCSLGVVLNYFTPSERERALWLPVVAVMLACSLIVALR
jgi:hypothetical protein